MMLLDPELPNDPEDYTSLTTPTGAELSAYIQGNIIIRI